MFPSEEPLLDAQLYTMIDLEGGRYRAFFSKLSDGGGFISREAALAFFRKSSLSEPQVQELYSRLKALQLLRDPQRMNESEFVMGMHFIVCMTKRNLVQIPPNFPSYLFPTLDLTPEKLVASFEFPSPQEPSRNLNEVNPHLSSYDEASPIASTDAKSLTELVAGQIRSKGQELEVLSRVDESQAKAMQSLHVCVVRISDRVDALGFPVPSSARALDALDDLKNLLQKHLQTAKQEIQSLQIDAQMCAAASDATQSGPREDPLKTASYLTQELMALQLQTAQLMAKKADVVGRIIAVTSGASADGSISHSGTGSFTESKNPAFALSKGALTVGELSASTTPPKSAGNNANPSLMQSHNSASSGGWGTFGAAKSQDAPPPPPFAAKSEDAPAATDPFGFAPAPQKSESTPAPDFAWGSFQ